MLSEVFELESISTSAELGVSFPKRSGFLYTMMEAMREVVGSACDQPGETPALQMKEPCATVCVKLSN